MISFCLSEPADVPNYGHRLASEPAELEASRAPVGRALGRALARALNDDVDDVEEDRIGRCADIAHPIVELVLGQVQALCERSQAAHHGGGTSYCERARC